MASQKWEDLLAACRDEIHPVVPFDSRKDRLARIDLDINSTSIDEATMNSLPAFSAWINAQLSRAGARYGIGGYNEHRGVYAASRVFDGKEPGEEPRRLHLGIDIWGPAGTAVMAPLDGIVHSFAFNNAAGDYGATIILTHRFHHTSFHTLYGHLSLASLGNLQEGDLVKKGDVFAAFGIPLENGHWPPHLHLQLVKDMGDWKGDYPGVCRFSERAKWLDNSPDPQVLLRDMEE